MQRLGRPGHWAVAALLSASTLIAAGAARAAEYAQGIYVLGNRGPLAGVIPPPGFYFESETYFYHCLLYTSPRPRDRGCARMPSSA